MKWYDPKPPRIGDQRVVTKFLWFPKNINGENRWLERASWVESWVRMMDNSWWEPKRWVD